MDNGIAEHFNSSLLNMLDPDSKVDWKSYFGSLIHAYNLMKHDSTGFPPDYLTFGHHPCITVDLALGKESAETHTTEDHYISNLRTQFKKAYVLADAKLNKKGCRTGVFEVLF